MSLEPEPLTPCRSVWTEPTEVMMNTCYLQHRFTRFRRMLIVLTQASITPQPGKRPFHHPTTPQWKETLLARRTTYHPNPVSTMMGPQPTLQLRTVILGIGLHNFQAGEVGAGQLCEH